MNVEADALRYDDLQADQRLHRQRGGDQGHHRHPRRARRRAAGPRGLPVRRRHGRAGQAGLLPPEARRRRRIHRGRGRGHRVRRQADRVKFIGRAEMRRYARRQRWPTRSPAPDRLRQHHRACSRSTAAPTHRRATAGGRVRAVLRAAPARPPRRAAPARRSRRRAAPEHARSAGTRSERRRRARPPAAGVGSRLEARGLQKSYGSRKVVKDVSLAVRQGRSRRPARPQRRRQDHLVLHDRRPGARRRRRDHIDGESVEHMPIHRRSRLGLSLPAAGSVDLPQAQRRGERARRARAAARRERQARWRRPRSTSA